MARALMTIDESMAILRETVPSLAALTEAMTPTELSAAPEEGSWSVNDVMAHLRACHDVFGGNVLRILAEDTPTWKGMSPRAWLKKTDYPSWQFAPAFEVFKRQRSELLAILEPFPHEAWARTARVVGMIGETYDYSAFYYADWMAGHERAHLKSLPHIMAAVSRR